MKDCDGIKDLEKVKCAYYTSVTVKDVKRIPITQRTIEEHAIIERELNKLEYRLTKLIKNQREMNISSCECDFGVGWEYIYARGYEEALKIMKGE